MNVRQNYHNRMKLIQTNIGAIFVSIKMNTHVCLILCKRMNLISESIK